MNGWEERISRRDVLKVGAAAGAGMFVGLGPLSRAFGAAPAPTAKAWSKVLKAAKEEGTVNYYSTNPDLIDPLQSAFKRAYPWATLNISTNTQNQIQAKVLTEAATGARFADVIDSRSLQSPVYQKANAVIAATLPNDARLAAGLRDPSGLLHRTYFVAIAGYVNTNALNKTTTNVGDLSALTNPQWSGKIAIDDPLNHSSGWNILASRRALWGDAKWRTWLEGLRQNEIRTFASSSDLYQALVQGDVAFGFDSLNDFLNQKAGAPAAVIWYTDVVLFYLGVSLVNKAPHPNAAKVFANWLLSSEGQRQFSLTKRFPTIPPPGSLSLAKYLPKGAKQLPISELNPYFNNSGAFDALVCQYMQC
jgi:iron(III) transport system substrate-binding protein